MAPKKKEVQKLSLGDFLNDTSLGPSTSWADEVEDTFGTQPLPPPERRVPTSSYGASNDRGYHSLRENLPQKLPEKPPFTAHLGNLSYDATVDTITEFFEGCNVLSVRIIEDREQNRPKGFAYAEFADLEGLKSALTRDGQIFQGRSIRIKVAEPPRGGFERPERELDWSQRRGPLTDIPPRGGDRRGPSDLGERRREFQPADDGKVRDFNNWERRGPLSPLPQQERPGSREGSRSRAMDARSESFRGNRRVSPAAWGPGEGRQDGSRPPRREFGDRPERPERVPTAAEKDPNWRNSMRPDASIKSPGESREGSEAPPSPAPAAALPAVRPKLNLAKRTVSEATDAAPAASTAADPKSSPFGAARPIDTAAREREIEERRQREKKEAEERAKEEKRAREAAAKEAAEKAAAEKLAAEKAAAEKAAAEKAAKENGVTESHADEAKTAPQETAPSQATNERKIPIRPREPREAPKSRAVESGNWRQPSGEQRAPSRGGHALPSGPRRGGPPRGPRDSARPPRSNGNGPAPQQPQSPNVDQAPSTPTVDEDGWTTVPNKGRRGQSNRAVA
ncbi:a70622a1-be73-4846-95c3-ef8d33556345 [Thermothielavioides terrestris]|uniref:RRM domain-containing protein n=2 Tax=Thermothielavioides terrestris TaxID=2587410 RepID=G2RBF0_THETT|nr:uncharacterized protein THITE_2119158 [Thermothielavioides terrestris NRRL 8126]AEO69121.1 hypothetical protein THITE_2119158 [Thermothielavioides terrestris NRRL 8126]SPQ22600.1 a70622a1-be73-4846-95c3-ef8d33556345 [Thermothielavioides terrestris]